MKYRPTFLEAKNFSEFISPTLTPCHNRKNYEVKVSKEPYIFLIVTSNLESSPYVRLFLMASAFSAV